MSEQDVINALKSFGTSTFYGEIRGGQTHWVTFADVLALIRKKNAEIAELKKKHESEE